MHYFNKRGFMENEYRDYYNKFLEINGKEKEIILCIEEMSELTQALSKYLRYKGTDKAESIIENIKEEIADTYNTLGQMQNIFKINDLKERREYKFNRYFK